MTLMEHLPWRVYHDEEHVAEFQQAVEKELILLQKARDDLYLQLRPSTSTWGMANYEMEYAIPSSKSKAKGQRLAAWRARRRGRSTTTETLIRSVAESYTTDPVDVNVYPSEYGFELKVPDVGGMPDYLEDLMAVVWEIKPAHLGMTYHIPLNTMDVIYAAGTTHQHIHQIVPLGATRRATQASSILPLGVCHLHIKEQIGGIGNARNDN